MIGMEFLTWGFLSSLLLIVGIDLILAGDNAIVIGLAARKLPKRQQKKAIIGGTIGAVAIRMVATLVVVTLLDIPGLHFVGGILLVWIAYKLLVDNNDHDDVKAGHTLGAAIKTIIIADALMGIDNVLAVAGAAHGSYILVGLGLLVSVPIVMWGSTVFIKLIDRFPRVVYLGSGILAFTAAKMIVSEPFIESFLTHALIKWGLILVIVVGVVLFGKRKVKSGNVKVNHRSQTFGS